MTTSNTPPVTPERIMQFAWGYVPPLVLEAAIKNRVFDTLDAGPRTIGEVQAATGASERGLAAIMNALVGLNFLAKDDQGRYSLAPESAAFLVSTKPAYQGGLISHCSQHLIPKWLHLNDIVMTGKPVTAVNQEAAGVEFFQKFVTDLFPMNYAAAQTLAKHLALSGPAQVLDLAAGSGVWGIALAQSSENVRVTAVDWPDVIPITRKTAARFGLADRFSFIEGDLETVEFGSNYSIATLGHILHSEGESRSRASSEDVSGAQAWRNHRDCRIPGQLGSQGPGKRSVVRCQHVFGVNMLVNTDSGSTYSFEEISEWLTATGFVNPRTLDSPGPSPLILATKP